MQRQVIVTRALMVMGALALGPWPASAQELPVATPLDRPGVVQEPAVPAPQNPPVGSAAPAVPAAPALQAEPEVVKAEHPPRRIDPDRRREQVIAMEGLLMSAVKSGATQAAKQMQSIEPGLQLFTGPARAKGFYLEDYGVFFHVEIPGVSPSVAWLFQSMERERNAFERTAQPARTSAGRAGPGFDPDAVYVLAVQQKLVDAMLDYRIDLAPSEWLTVAARDGEAPLNPSQLVESAIMILRVRASDLADFYAGRITRDEARAKVEVREF